MRWCQGGTLVKPMPAPRTPTLAISESDIKSFGTYLNAHDFHKKKKRKHTTTLTQTKHEALNGKYAPANDHRFNDHDFTTNTKVSVLVLQLALACLARPPPDPRPPGFNHSYYFERNLVGHPFPCKANNVITTGNRGCLWRWRSAISQTNKSVTLLVHTHAPVLSYAL